MSEVTEAQLKELIEKQEQAKVLYLKYVGAVEALTSILNQSKKSNEKPETKKASKSKK